MTTGSEFPILGTNEKVPWSAVAPHEAQARINHTQSLERLAQRGGLTWGELLAVLCNRPWRSTDNVPSARADCLKIIRGDTT